MMWYGIVALIAFPIGIYVGVWFSEDDRDEH